MRKIYLAVAVAAAVAIQANAATGTVSGDNAEIVGKARFTLLTDRMVRCEWSEDGRFEDRPSITFINRAMPPVKHTLTHKVDGAVRVFIEKDWPRLEKTLTPEFAKRMRTWLLSRQIGAM